METTEMIDTIVPEALTEDIGSGLNPVVVVAAVAAVAAAVGGVWYWRKRSQANEVEAEINKIVTDIAPE